MSWPMALVEQFVPHIVGLFLVVAGHRVQEIWEKYKLDDHEKHKEFYRDNQPQRAPQGHRSEAIEVEVEDAAEPVVATQFFPFHFHKKLIAKIIIFHEISKFF